MNQNIIETVVGIMVLALAIICMFLAYQSGTLHRNDNHGYVINAHFSNADGLHIGSKVKIGGVEIGEVKALSLDPSSYKATVLFSIQQDVQLSSDTSAMIVSSGLLGEKYLAITPGSDTETLSPGNTLQFTQSSVNLEELLSKFMFSSSNSAAKTAS